MMMCIDDYDDMEEGRRKEKEKEKYIREEKNGGCNCYCPLDYGLPYYPCA